MSYSKPSISNYNASPPPDDASQISANVVRWSNHITKIGDPLKSYIDAVNNATEGAWNDLASTSTTSDGAALVAYKHQTDGAFSTGAAASTVQGVLDKFITTSINYNTTTTITQNLTFVDGGMIVVGAGVVLTLSGHVRGPLSQIFDTSSGGTIVFTNPQTVYPEWWGTSNTAIQSAFKSSAAGSITQLQGKQYESVAIAWDNDPLAADGSDTGKVIQGVLPAQRYETTGDFYGTVIKLAASQNSNVITVDSGGANLYGSGAIRNLMIDGNKGSQAAGSGIEIQDCYDFFLENLYIWNCKENGLYCSGNNSQLNIEGFIESYNNDTDGFNFGAIGDAQVNGSLRAVNNGRYGLLLGAGKGRFEQIYSYFNTNHGVFIAASVDDDVFIEYLRSEDNDKSGCVIAAKNVHIAHADCPDNGADVVASTVITDRAGVYLTTTAEDVNIDVLTASYRTSAVTHNQITLLYDASANGCGVRSLVNRAFGLHTIAGAGTEVTATFTNTTSISGCFIDRAMTISDTYANIKNAGASITPLPDTYSRYKVTALSEATTISNPAGARSAEGMKLDFEIVRDAVVAGYNISWGTDFLDGAGSALSATATTADQTVKASFVRRNSKWYLSSPIVVS